jgi:hypothetical protein
MTRVVRYAALACVAGVLVASAAFASVPDPAQSTVGNFIELEGTTSGVADNCVDVALPATPHCGKFLVTVRDGLGAVISGSSVVIDFSACTDALISCDQNFSVTGVQGYAASKKITGTTNAAGQFEFRPQGAENSNTLTQASPYVAPGAALGAKCGTVYADGVPLKNLQVIAYDIDGQGSATAAVGGADNATQNAEVVRTNPPISQPKKDRNDLNHDGAVTGADNAIMGQYVLQSIPPSNSGTKDTKHSNYCP